MNNTIVCADCVEYMKNHMEDGCVDTTITDIPYDACNGRVVHSEKFTHINKGTQANDLNFDLYEFIDQVHRVTKNNIIIFCGQEQFSYIKKYMIEHYKGTSRCLVWEKSNCSPMNGQHIYLSGVELAVWFKKKGSKVFNAFCKNTVFKHSSGRGKLHPTEKNHKLIKELIMDNSNEGDIIFDPCAGSGAHLLCAKETGRKFYGIEISPEYFEIIKQRVGDDSECIS